MHASGRGRASPLHVNQAQGAAESFGGEAEEDEVVASPLRHPGNSLRVPVPNLCRQELLYDYRSCFTTTRKQEGRPSANERRAPAH